MTEAARIRSLFEKLYDGHPWLDVNILSTLSKLTAAQAAKRAIPECNTIWEITNHMIHWRLNVLRRVQGEIIESPVNNYIEKITDQSDAAWKQTLENFALSQRKWLDLLSNYRETDLAAVYPPNRMTYYENIQGILQHDAYHLGQIVILAKSVK